MPREKYTLVKSPSFTYISLEKWVVVDHVLVKKTQELLQVGNKEIRDIVAGQVVEDLCQEVEGLKENLQLRTILCVGLNHVVRCLR